MVTTDKVYENREWAYGYREPDRLGGADPYSASKAAAEIAIASWRSSYCGPSDHQTSYLRIATARAGNVIGGGDWAADRIVPDAIRSLIACQPIPVRNPLATRPWQHVLEPLGGYLLLAQALACDPATPCEAFNFGPTLASNRSVKELVESILSHWGVAGLISAIRTHRMRPTCCTCRLIRPTTGWVGRPAGTTTPLCVAPWIGITITTKAIRPWPGAWLICRPTKPCLRPLPSTLRHRE